MVIGLDLFREHFRSYTDSYVLIGGTACELALEEAGFSFRATKDLDIVLCIEVLNKEFVSSFWEFVNAGRYKIQQKATGSKQYYRFKGPATKGYPFMLELFSRVPDMLQLDDESHLTPIPTDGEIDSLSAILLDDDYYNFLNGGKKDVDGLSFIGPEHLIPLKCRAWLDLSKRKEQGESVDSKKIKNHKNDVFRLYQILNPDFAGEVPDKIKDDLREFISLMRMENIDFKALGLGAMELDAVLEDIGRIYVID